MSETNYYILLFSMLLISVLFVGGILLYINRDEKN